MRYLIFDKNLLVTSNSTRYVKLKVWLTFVQYFGRQIIVKSNLWAKSSTEWTVNPVNLNWGEIYRECDGIWQMTISIIQFTNLWFIFRYVKLKVWLTFVQCFGRQIIVKSNLWAKVLLNGQSILSTWTGERFTGNVMEFDKWRLV